MRSLIYDIVGLVRFLGRAVNSAGRSRNAGWLEISVEKSGLVSARSSDSHCQTRRGTSSRFTWATMERSFFEARNYPTSIYRP